jgi:NAD(P)H-hydrate epimerase
VIVLAGPGGNGGGGLVAARHLVNRGRAVGAVLARRRGEMAQTTAHQLDILECMGVAVVDAAADLDATLSADANLIIDAVIGYSLRGAPQAGAARLIRWVKARPAPVLSLDAPSGLDVTSGTAADPCVRATATMTLALPKIGLIGASQVGELYLADISVPRALYRKMGIEVGDLFAQDSIIRVQSASPVVVDGSRRTGERQR